MATASPNSPLAITILFASLSLSNSSLYSSPNNSSTLTPKAADKVSAVAPPTIGQLYNRVRGIHYKSYFHYLYFNTVKWSYFQGMVIVPYLALAPTIVTGAITLGFVQQITRAFGRVEGSLQYLVKSWSTIVELISVWKRLREFEARLNFSSDLKVKV